MTAPTTLPPSMQAYVGTPDGPALQTVPIPTPEENEALVKVTAFSINRGELGLFARRPQAWRPGQDLSGVVVREAADGSGPPVGSRVVAMVDFGAWAEYCAVETVRMALLPPGVGDAESAGLGVAGLTALRALRRGGSLLGQRVLVTGASGGVGTFAVQLATASGAEVTALTGTQRSVDLHSLGATEVICSLEDTYREFDLVLESVGGPVLEGALRRLTPRGTLVLLGTSSRVEAPLSISTFRPHARQTLHPFWVFGSGEPVGADLAVLVGLIGRLRLRPVIGWQGCWRRLDEAMTALRERRVPGKAVLVIESESAA